MQKLSTYTMKYLTKTKYEQRQREVTRLQKITTFDNNESNHDHLEQQNPKSVHHLVL